MILAFVKLGALNLDAQYYSYGQHVNYANQSFEEGKFLLAMEHYDKALELNPKSKDKDLIFNFAESAYNTYSLNKAEMLYDQYMLIGDEDKLQDVQLKLARIKQLQGRYEEAILDYNVYISEYGDQDSTVTKEIAFLKSSAQWAIDSNVESLVDSLTKLPDSINTQFSEFAPFEINDSLYFNSLRIPKDIEKETQYHSSIFNTNGEVMISGLEGSRLVSHPSFTDDGKYIFYTVGDFASQDKISVSIYFSFIDENGIIGEARKMSDKINGIGSTNTHPMVATYDSSYVMYFVSDRYGGKGGLDVWRVDLDRSLTPGDPQNVREVNTPKDEMSPFYQKQNETLYWSSNGRKGYGDHDVYKTKLGQENALIENMGDVVNSPNNDVYFSMNENGSRFYLSSNRPGSKYLSDLYETCCYDIYRGELKECEIDLLALTFDQLTEAPLEGCRLVITDKTTGEVVYDEISNTNSFEPELDCEKEYELTVSRDGYEDKTISFFGDDVLFGEDNNKEEKIYLTPAIYDLTISVYDLDTNLPVDSIDIIFVDLETGEETVVSKHPTNEYTFEVEPNREYEIRVTRRGYQETIERITTGPGGAMERDIFIKEKEIIRKAKVSLANAIPVALYFDHDQPGSGTMVEKSPVNYTNAYYKYYNRRPNYVDKYTARYRGARKDDALLEINNFFSGEVKKGFDKYEIFKNQLILVLESGQKVNIYLRGYTSPIAPSEYNVALGKRRIDSVRREFDEWGNGALLPYIRSGQLSVTERSFGEETSPKNISDDPRTPAQSIYSPSASKERRVEIDEINFNQDK